MSIDAIEPYRSLGMRETCAGPDRVAISVPLDGNRNDKGTLFGGSMYSAMVLAGWRLANLKAHQLGKSGDVYVKRSTIDFLRPIRSEMQAVATLKSPPADTPSGNLAFEVAITASDETGATCGRADASYRLLRPQD